MDKEQTALEWFIEETEKLGYFWGDIVDKALKMQQEQLTNKK
jgi:hypothetical protein